MSKQAEIQPLSDNVINQIAAGEVIERPASIVRELLENSLDAGATKITIELRVGGIEYIRLHDDGYGIPRGQLHLALSRHCTSKLTNAEQLSSIGTLGFRGEALASISSVAEIAITSRTADQPHGWRIEVRPGARMSQLRAEGHPVGTTIEVRNLFATTPARRRFLKQVRTEFLHVQKFVRRAGFCYPEVAFTLIHGLKKNLLLPEPINAAAVERRRRTLFGSDFVDHSIPIEFITPEVTLRGWVGTAEYARQNSDLQFVTINRRVVRDRHVAHAVRMAYDTFIEEGRYPAYAVQLEMPEGVVDVNVHPGKVEVRLHDPRRIHDIVYAAVKQTLSGADSSHKEWSSPITSGQTEVESPRMDPGRRAQAYSHQRATQLFSSSPLLAVANNLLAIIENRFALTDDNGAIFVTDLHAAITDVVRTRLDRGERKSRPLLVPEVLDIQVSDDRIDVLTGLGVELGRIGEETLVLRAVPIFIREIDPSAFADCLLANDGTVLVEADGVAAAAAVGFRAPTTMVERRRWFAQLVGQFDTLGLSLGNYNILLTPENVAGLFGT